MNIIVCIDDAGGMLFCGRRQSLDRVLRSQALLLAGDQPLWMNGYSAGQFSQDGGNIVVDEAFMEKAPEDAWCFIENTDITPWKDQIGRVAVYRWNRVYPSDVKFPMSLFEEKWQLASRREFPGSSHDTITEEVYHL